MVASSKPPDRYPSDFSREVFSVNGERVTLEDRRGWQCTCPTYAERRQCPHLFQARIFRDMRCTQRKQEVPRGAAPLQELQAARFAQRDFCPKHPASSSWKTIAAAAALSGMMIYLIADLGQRDGVDELGDFESTTTIPGPHVASPVLPVRLVDSNDVPAIAVSSEPAEPNSAPPDETIEPAVVLTNSG
jgi:hypothetical protein